MPPPRRRGLDEGTAANRGTASRTRRLAPEGHAVRENQRGGPSSVRIPPARRTVPGPHFFVEIYSVEMLL